MPLVSPKLRSQMNSLVNKARYVRDKLQREGLIPTLSLDKTCSWVKAAPASLSPKVCVLASYCKGGLVSEHTLFLARGWHREGFEVILVIASDDPERVRISDALLGAASGVMLRKNSGYDFGSWATALTARPDLRKLSLLALANDSVYGPLSGFSEVLARVDASPADVIAMTDSFELRYHIQSFLVFYKRGALESKAFARFWNSVRGCGRTETIQWSEIPQLQWLQKHGLHVDILYRSASDCRDNPTLVHWRRLLNEGFPFVKAQLLRENPWKADIVGWTAN